MAAEEQKKSSRNPYMISGPIQNSRQFFGRQNLLQWILEELNTPGRNALVLHGQRRIGKTSLLNQLSHTLPVASYLPVYFDLQKRATQPTAQTLLELCAALDEAIGVDTPSKSVLPIELIDPYGYYLQHEHLPKVYATLGNVRRPVFLLDEFDVLARYATDASSEGDPARELLKIIRRIQNSDPFSAFIFVVRRPAEDFPLDFSSVFRDSGSQEVWAVDRLSAEEIIRQAESDPVEGKQTLAFSLEAIERVIQLTSGHPYLTQMMGYMIWERAYQTNPKEIPLITLENVEAAIPDTLEGASQALNWLWLSMRPVEKYVAATVADHSDEGATVSTEILVNMLAQHAAQLQVKEVRMAPQELAHRRLLEEADTEQGTTNEYRFAVELFRRFVRQNKPLEEIKEQLETSDPLIGRLYEIGQGFMMKNQPGNAIRYFQDALKANPQHFPSQLHLGEALMLNKQDIQAVQELEKAFTHDPDVARPLLVQATVQLAKQYVQEGEEEKALAAFGRILQLAPNHEDANQYWKNIWTQRANEALNQGDIRAAIEAFRQGGNGEMAAKLEVIDRRTSLVNLEAQGLQFVRSKEWSRAAGIYEKLIAQAPDLESRSTWQATLELCREEFELADLFQQGKEALNLKDTGNAQRAFLAILYRRINYRVSNERASQLLDMAVKAMPYRETEFPAPVIPEAERLLVSINPNNADRLKPIVFRGNGIPQDIAVSGDGQYLGIATSLGVVIYHAQTLKVIRNITSLTWVTHLTFSKNSELLAIGSLDQTVHIYQTSDWAMISEFNRHTSLVTCLAFSPDQSLLAVGTKTPVIYVWRLSDGKMMRILEGHNDAIRSVIFSPDGSLIVSGSDDRTIRLWRGNDGFPVGILPDHHGTVTGLAFTPDGRSLVSGSVDKTLRLWRVKDSRKLTQTIQGGFGAFNCLTLTPDGQTAVAGDEKRIWMIPLNGKTNPTAIEGHSASVIGVAHAADRNTVFSISLDGSLRSWHISRTIQPGPKEFFGQAIFSLAYSPDGKKLATGLLDGKIEIVDTSEPDLRDLRLVRSFEVQPGPVYSLAFSSNGQSLAVAQRDSIVSIWQVDNGNLLYNLEGHTQPVLGLCYSPDGKLLATASHDQSAILWDTENGALKHKLQHHKGSISCVAFSPSGQFVATGSADNHVQLWQVSDGKPIQTLEGHQAGILQLAFSPNSDWLASASEDQTIRVWQVSNGALLQTMEGFEGKIYSLAFSPNSQLLSSGSQDQMIRIWDTHLWKEIGVLTAHTGSVTCLAFAPDGSRLASGSEDGVLRIWSAD